MTSLFLSLVAMLFSCNTTNTPPPDAELGEGLYAEIQTNKGKIVLQLEYKKTPLTVANFVSLAEGTNDMVTTPGKKGKPFYDGIKFHRVIKNFMIQGGDPNGDGTGGPGYKFADEITDLKHDKAGILSMANAGKATNGSQFFITHNATPHLDGLHTVFGHIVQGQDVVNAIEQGDEMTSVKILRIGKEAKKFDAQKVFKEYYLKAAEEQKKLQDALAKTKADKVAELAQIKAGATKTASGLQYKITQKGNGGKPLEGSTVYIHYAGYFEDGMLFDSSREEIAKQYGKHDPARAAANAYTPIPFAVGTKSGMIPGFIEGIEKLNVGDKGVIFIPSHLGYGERGAGGGIIPPNANLIFELEVLAKPQ
ncbi:peptidylprolyl isomerase [Flavobacterium cyanobacteriorum]|uniref:peptidylprolyl isomerase n=2 Tax=Flavobacterium cyanobacteriorum TaxID=2022802 RepID=A0A255ZB34_9FLAO|nr:peptidylprolyl isomerase [Flavobacterium cyanobacteriorum]